jgi:hypothetical protein
MLLSGKSTAIFHYNLFVWASPKPTIIRLHISSGLQPLPPIRVIMFAIMFDIMRDI